jgi:predicted acylesterase/phospholipase RssA
MSNSPAITSVSPSSGSAGTSVTIVGANFGTPQGTSTVTFNGVAATPTSWSATQIVAPVPRGATTGNVVVTVNAQGSNKVFFTVTISFKDAHQEEIRELRDARPGQQIDSPCLVGLAFSGGGIRSATFNLGVLQALARFEVLSKFHYLSTVSGGGYIGSWLVAWIKHRNSDVYKALGAEREEPHQIRFLREYSNYLTPRRGFLGTDTWTMIATYLRNTFLNLTTLVLALIAVLLLPQFLALQFFRESSGKGYAFGLACASMGFAMSFMVANLSDLFRTDEEQEGKKYVFGTLKVRALIVLPFLLGAWLLSVSLWAARNEVSAASWLLCGFYTGAAYLGLWLLGWLSGEGAKRRIESETAPGSPQVADQPAPRQGKKEDFYGLARQFASRTFDAARKRSIRYRAVLFCAFVSGFIAGLLLIPVARWMNVWNKSEMGEWYAASFGLLLVVVLFLLVVALHIGFAGRGFSDEAREWLGRLGATLLLWTLWLTGLLLIAFYGPLGVQQANAWLKVALTSGWLLTTGAGILLGKGPLTGISKNKGVLTIVSKIAPPVFVVGMLLLLATVSHKILPSLINLTHTALGTNEARVHGILGEVAPSVFAKPNSQVLATEAPRMFGPLFFPHAGPRPDSDLAKYRKQMDASLDGCVLLCSIGFALAAVLTAWRIGINDFSMHAFYRNRLVRCYLGATNPKPHPHPFTGFDPEDDRTTLADLKAAKGYKGPYPIFNAALNLVHGEKLAWQQRKAASFVFTPLFCGYELDEPSERPQRESDPSKKGFARTERNPTTLGTAVATSGAAASPNMGYHSSPALSFLMTVFNVRLGLWMGNPNSEYWTRPGPKSGLFYLLCELFGETNERRHFVYLSDGGHFENLGIYELVRRKCRFILACDASEDREMKFADLGNAIEKCRTDFGYDIDINIDSLRRQKDTNHSQWHCAVGRIHYERVYQDFPSGTLVYLKSSLTGDEPADVQRYAAQNPKFPHQSTADQWFDESQFESYRALGQHVAESVLRAVGEKGTLKNMSIADLFCELRQRWYPPSRHVLASFTKHTATYSNLVEKIRRERSLKFLDPQIYPEWPRLISPPANARQGSLWLPDSESERRAGFYFCNQIIQLMEDVYVDLDLEEEYDHPDNRGWMNLFRHWAWSGMFCATWAISASTYGARFQRFCERRLDLHLGEVEIPDQKEELKLAKQGDQRSTALEEAKKAQVLNFWEVELIKTFLAWGRKPGELPELQILPFEMVVESPTRDPDQRFKFSFGFALVAITAASPRRVEIWYFRVQNHLRNIGLARKTLEKLMKKYRYRVENKVEKAPPRPADDPNVPPEGTSKDEALPTAEAVQQFRQLFDSVKLEGPKETGGESEEPS